MLYRSLHVVDRCQSLNSRAVRSLESSTPRPRHPLQLLCSPSHHHHTTMSRVARAPGASTKKGAEDGGASHLSHSLHSLSIQQHSLSQSAPPKSTRAAADPTSDICPVCKSSRYLNPNMRFLVNPECYHKMCESCVDRIFSHGPAPCPIAGCKKTLRKARFRMQTFEDLKVEREVDIRRRVAKA